MAGETDDDDPLGRIEGIERALLGAKRVFNRKEVADKAGMPIEVAEELWQQLGFPHASDDDVAFTKEDLKALQRTQELISLGILTPESQAALVRTWGRSFARLAEWQVSLLAELAIEDEDPRGRLTELMDVVLPRVEKLQTYIWRRHLESAASRLLSQVADEGPGTTSTMAVGFVDIVGYTGQSKTLSDADLVEWVEYFENEMTRIVVDLGGRVIKTIGDEVLFVADDPVAAAEAALIVTERGEDDDDKFPRVRAGIAYGEVVSRLGDVYGPQVNIAVPADVGGPARERPGRPRSLRGAVRADRRGLDRDDRAARRRRVAAAVEDPRPGRGRAGPDLAVHTGRRLPLPAPAPQVGQGVLPARAVAAASFKGRTGEDRLKTP